MVYKSITVKKKKDCFNIDYRGERYERGSLWECGGTFGKLYPVDGFIVMTLGFSMTPSKVFKDQEECFRWIESKTGIIPDIN